MKITFPKLNKGPLLLSPVKISGLGDLKSFLGQNTKPILVLITLCLLVYVNILNSEFVFDDIVAYVESSLVRDLAESIRTLKMQSIYYAVFYKLFQLNPTPFHVVSLLLHVFCVLLLFIFTAVYFDKKVAIIVSALFAVHPVNSEVVNWISAVNYLINFIVTFLVMIFYGIYFNSRKTTYLLTSLVIYLFGFISSRNPLTLTVFPMIFVLDQFVLQDHFNFWTKAFIKRYLGFVFLSIFFLIVFVLPNYGNRINNYATTLQFDYDAALGLEKRIPLTLSNSFYLLIYPKNLKAYHFGNQLQIEERQFLKSNVFVLLAFLVTLIIYKLNRKVSGLIFLFVASLLPFLNPIQSNMIVAERYLYFGTAFFSVFVGLLLLKVEQITKVKDLAVNIAILLLVVFSIRTFIRNTDWYTRESFWLAEVRLNPNMSTPYTFLGNIYGQRGEYPKSIEMYKKAVEINPGSAYPLIGAGNVYAEVGKLDLAEEFYLAAIEANPYLPIPYHNLAFVKLARGDHEAVLEYLDRALSVDPNYYPALRALEEIKSNN